MVPPAQSSIASSSSKSLTVPSPLVSPVHAEATVVVVDVVLVVVADTDAVASVKPVLVTVIVIVPALVAVTESIAIPLAFVVPGTLDTPAPLAETVAPPTASAENVLVTVTVTSVAVPTATEVGDTETVSPPCMVVVVALRHSPSEQP